MGQSFTAEGDRLTEREAIRRGACPTDMADEEITAIQRIQDASRPYRDLSGAELERAKAGLMAMELSELRTIRQLLGRLVAAELGGCG